jgi:hypothetical protein
MEEQAAPTRWRTFRASPFFPACVLVVLIAAAAGLFAGSYTYAMANPTPRHIPTAVTGVPTSEVKRAEFVAGMEQALGASLQLHHYDTFAAATGGIEAQKVFAILTAGRAPHLYVSSASGASVAQLLAETAPSVSARIGQPVTVSDINPLQKGDPRGLAIFYISLAAVILGFVGAIQLSVHARPLNPAERIAFIAAYALLGGFSIAAVVDWGLGAVDLPFAESWLILAFTLFTSGMVFTMFNTLVGPDGAARQPLVRRRGLLAAAAVAPRADRPLAAAGRVGERPAHRRLLRRPPARLPLRGARGLGGAVDSRLRGVAAPAPRRPLDGPHGSRKRRRPRPRTGPTPCGGWGRGRTGDLPLFRRSLVPTELPSRSGPDGI